MASRIKSPDEILDYTRDWEPELGTDTIATSAWTLPTGLTEVSGSDTHDDTTSSVKIAGGEPNTDYDAVCTITTAADLTEKRTLRVRVRKTRS